MMNSKISWQEWMKCLFIGIFLTITGMLLQVSKSILLLQKNAPQPSFIIGVTICYIITGILFARGYYFVKDTLPGKSGAARGLIYALLVFSSAWFANIFGMIAFDFVGKFDLLTSAKIETYAITVVDAINLMLGGVVLGLIVGKKKSLYDSADQAKQINRKGQVVSSVIGFFLFPILIFVFFKIVSLVIPFDVNIPQDAELWFNLGLFVPLIVTGVSLPIFYGMVRSAFPGSWYEKGTIFSGFFFIFCWLMVIVFVIPFGFSMMSVISFLVTSLFPIFFVIMMSARMQEVRIVN